ncbi:MAG: glycosyltransferase family 2 protein [Acidiferrobacteraceae bacterium]
MDLISVIVSTYNRPDALMAVLRGLRDQDDPAFEVVIADDGSTPETGELVRTFAGEAPFPVHHIWHEDAGFRLGAIRNRAIAATQAPYLLFLDGDCIPRPRWVAVHRALRRPGAFLYGHRVLLGPDLTRRALGMHLPLHHWGFRDFVRARLRGEINRLLPVIPRPEGLVWEHRSWKGVKGCHLSAWRDDLQRVNGFDEAYAGWGFEDSDLVVRLFRAGLRALDARGAPAVLHLWHPQAPQAHAGRNQALFQERLRAGLRRAQRGVDQYL